MDRPLFFPFIPVPLRARCDGWAPELQLRFIELLANGVKPGEAARRLGKNRQNVYALRRRPGAESFASAWDAAAAFARNRKCRTKRGPSQPGLPSGARADTIVSRGEQAVRAAGTRSQARLALNEMLDGLYGPKSDNSDNSDGESFVS